MHFRWERESRPAEKSQGKPGRAVGVRLNPVGGHLLAWATILTIYAELAVAFYQATHHFPQWGYAAAGAWVLSSLLLVLWSVAEEEGQLMCVPPCCRELIGGRHDSSERPLGRGGSVLSDSVVTLLQLRLGLEASRYHRKWDAARRADEERGADIATCADWRHATQQAQIYFLKWQRNSALAVHTPQVVLQAYFQVALDKYSWYGVSTVVLSVFTMAFGFSTAHCEALGLRASTFCRDIFFHSTYIGGMLICYALFAACHKEWVVVVVVFGVITNGLILHYSDSPYSLPCCDRSAALEPCELTLSRLLFGCVGRLIYVDVGRMQVHIWCPLWRPVFGDPSRVASWYIFWKNWFVALVILVPVFIRRHGGAPEWACDEYVTRIAPPHNNLPWEKKLCSAATLAALNVALFLWSLHEDHDPRLATLELSVEPIRGPQWEEDNREPIDDDVAGTSQVGSIGRRSSFRNEPIDEPEPGAPVAVLFRTSSGSRLGRRRDEMAGLGLAPSPRSSRGSWTLSALSQASSDGRVRLMRVQRASPAHRQGLQRYVGSRVCGGEGERNARGALEEVLSSGEDARLLFEDGALRIGDAVQVLRVDGRVWLPATVVHVGRRAVRVSLDFAFEPRVPECLVYAGVRRCCLPADRGGGARASTRNQTSSTGPESALLPDERCRSPLSLEPQLATGERGTEASSLHADMDKCTPSPGHSHGYAGEEADVFHPISPVQSL
eukprot:Hpha_TRINITY_DN14925_c0_g6::TRINITY_DN14925_c0_g6_i1::g.144962::m.144962